MTTPEGKVKVKVKQWLKGKNIWFYCPMQNGMGVAGIPDFICCDEGVFFAIETKAPGKEKNLSPNQVNRIREIHEHGGKVFVVSSVEKLDEEYNQWRAG